MPAICLGWGVLGGLELLQKTGEYREEFLRGESKELKVVKLGVKTLHNCVQIGQVKMH